MNHNLLYWLTLWRIPGIGPAKFFRYLKQYPDLQELFQQPEFAHAPFKAAEQDLNWARQPEHHIITILDSHYPSCLKQITYAPPLLFVIGNPSLLQTNQLAIVGSRHASKQGIQNAQYFATELAKTGWTITSGLALGIDAASHEATLNAHGQTVAVMATGADQIYPKRHEKLAERIRENSGALVTEFPLGTPPQAEHFPRRNRIISGLSQGIIVIEAGEKSGSLITADYALEQNREVFAVPGSIQNVLTRGCHQLIRQGATLVDKVEDVLQVFGSTGLGAMRRPVDDEEKKDATSRSDGDEEKKCTMRQPDDHEEKNTQDPTIHEHSEEKNLSAHEKILIDHINFQPIAVDILIEKSKLSTEEVTSHLLCLELKGLIRSTMQGYVRN